VRIRSIVRQRACGGHVRFRFGWFVQSPLRAHLRRQKHFQFRIARGARADAHALPARRRIELRRRRGREQRVAVWIVNPMRTEIKRHGERLRVGDAAPADTVLRLEDEHAHFVRREPPRCGNARRTCPNHDYVRVFARRLCRERRPSREQRRGG
jgi:hypothetical protein